MHAAGRLMAMRPVTCRAYQVDRSFSLPDFLSHMNVGTVFLVLQFLSGDVFTLRFIYRGACQYCDGPFK